LADSLVFWIIAAAMTAAALAFVLPRLFAHSVRSHVRSRAAMNAALLRGEIAELDREHAEGRLSDAEHARAKLDVERRLLAEAGTDAEVAPRPVAPFAVSPRGVSIGIAVALPMFAFALYAVFGDPDALRMNRAASASAGSTADAPAGRDDLVRHLARHPRDGRGWTLLARTDFAADRFTDAAEAYAKALATPKVAADPSVWCEYADALGMAQGGSLAGKPRELIGRALALDPAHPRALEMAGSAAYEQRDYGAAAQYWSTLLARIPEGAPAHRELAAAVARAQRLALVAGPESRRK